MASLYAKMADEMLKNNSAFKPDDICLKDIYLSRVRMISGDRKGAEEYLSSAIKLFSEKIDVGYPFTTKQSTLLAGIIEVLFDMPRYLENVDYFKSTVTFIGDPMQRLVASSTDNLTLPEEQLFLDSAKAALIASEVLIKSGNYSDAQKIVDDCIIKMDRGGHVNFSKESIYYLDALALKAAVFKMSGETQSAKETLKDWVENYKQRFSDVVQCSSEQQRLLFSSKQHPLDFLMLMDDPLSVAELLFFYKGSVIDSILNSKSIINNSDDISLKRELANMNLQKSQGNSSQDISSMEQDLANKVRNKFTESDILEVIKNQNFMQLAKCLPESSCFIDYFKYDSFGRLGHSNPHYGAIVITGMGKLAMVKLAESTIIDTLIEKLRKINATFSGNENDTAMSDVCNSLYNELIKPLESYISTSNDYIISPDSKLNFVPFAALIDPVGKFLIEKKSIHYVSSGRDLLKEFQVNPKKNMVIIANPKFDRDTLSSNNKGVFPPLPGTAKEAEQIKGVMDAGSYSITILQDTNATKDAVINLNQPRILHIATHGFNLCASDGGTDDHPTRGLKVVGTSYGGNMMTNVPDKPNPMFKTGLAFCGANDTFRSWNIGQAGAAEGILTAAEVPLINLNGASLVTLSACQTGEGEVVGGEGVFGLRRGFLQSGAKNLLMTLWPIADQETVDIMTEFYKKIAANDDDPGNSLSEVQRQWMPKLKSEKGVCYAINRAAPFIIFTKGKMASRSYAQNDHVSATDSSNTTTQITNPSAAIEDRFNHAICEFTDALSKADAGDAYAQGVVSIYYTIGYKAPKDTAKGLAYALKSAAQKNPLGIYQVGALRELGSGMKKDKAQAHKLMSAAFDGLNTLSGDPYALYDLGYMALAGIGVDQNPKEAARLFKTSADLGYAPSQRMYAKLLEAGVGVPKDLESAMQYEKQYRLQWPEQQ
jgi:CHAT domain-containing protein